MSLLPHFNVHGILPPKDYRLTFDELRLSTVVQGNGTDPDWDIAWRLHLINQCEVMVQQLWQTGIDEIFLDGSFVEEKSHPNDIDGYFVCDAFHFASGDLQRDLNALDTYKIWTWDPATRRSYRGYAKKQLPMWHRYRVELYPHFGQPSGIRDQFGHELQFPSAFRQQRGSGTPKGVIQILQGRTQQ